MLAFCAAAPDVTRPIEAADASRWWLSFKVVPPIFRQSRIVRSRAAWIVASVVGWVQGLRLMSSSPN